MSISHRGRKFKKGIIYPLFFEVSENEDIKLAIKNFGNLSIYPNENFDFCF